MPFTSSNKYFIFTRGQRTGTKMPVTLLRRNILSSTAYRHQIAGKKKWLGYTINPLVATTLCKCRRRSALKKGGNPKQKNNNEHIRPLPLLWQSSMALYGDVILKVDSGS